MRYLFFFILAFLFIISCSNNKYNSGEKEFTNDLPQIIVPEELVNLTNLMGDVEVIQLETDSTCLIGDLTKLIQYDNRFFVYDGVTSSVFCFNLDGKFLFQVGKQGKGPTEYNKLRDISINTENRTIELLDRAAQCILCYDLDGNYLEKIRIGEYFSSFVCIDKGYIFQRVSDNPDFYVLKITNTMGKVISNFIPCKALDNTLIRNQLTIDNNKIFITHGSYYTVYSFNNQEIVPFCSIDFGKKNLPDKILNKSELDAFAFLKIAIKDYTMAIYGFYESIDYFTFSYFTGKSTYWAVYNKNTQKTVSGELKLFDEKLIPPFYKKDGYFYTCINQLFLEGINKKDITFKNEIENTIYQKLDKSRVFDRDELGTINPFIIRFKLKE